MLPSISSCTYKCASLETSQAGFQNTRTPCVNKETSFQGTSQEKRLPLLPSLLEHFSEDLPLSVSLPTPRSVQITQPSQQPSGKGVSCAQHGLEG